MSNNKVKFGDKEYLMVEARLSAMAMCHKDIYSLVISNVFIEASSGLQKANSFAFCLKPP